MKRCLCCYQPLKDGEVDYHPRCAKRLFGQPVAPSLPYTRKDINKLAQVVVESRTTVTGVQAKLSMDLEHDANGRAQRLTIVGVMGRYILKPQTEPPGRDSPHTHCSSCVDTFCRWRTELYYSSHRPY